MAENYTYKKLISLVENFASEHLQIKRFASEYQDQINQHSTSGNTFPFLYMSLQDSTLYSEQTVFNIRLTCIDIAQKDRSNVNDIVSDTEQVLNDFRIYLSELNTDVPVLIVNDPIAYPLNNYSVDGCVGHYMDVQIECDSYGLCEIPFENVPVLSGYSCDVFYINDYLTCSKISGCTQLSDFIHQIVTTAATSDNFYTTGATLIGTVAYFNRNDSLSAYTLQLSGLTSGITATGAYLNLSGGTVTGDTQFTESLSAATVILDSFVGTVTSTATTVDWNLATNFYYELQSDTTISFSNDKNGQTISIALEQDSTGNRSVTWPATLKWPFGSVPVMTSLSGKTDIYTLIKINGSIYASYAQNY